MCHAGKHLQCLGRDTGHNDRAAEQHFTHCLRQFCDRYTLEQIAGCAATIDSYVIFPYFCLNANPFFFRVTYTYANCKYKKKPTSKNRGGYFLCFRYVDCLCLLRGQDNDLSLVDGVGVHKTVGVALEDGLVLHQTGICQPNCFLISAFTLSKSLQVKIGISRLISSTLLSHHLNLSSNSISSSSKRF